MRVITAAKHSALKSIGLSGLASLVLLAPLAGVLLASTPAEASLPGLVQGAIPNQTTDTPSSLQTLFGAKTGTTPTLGTDYLPAGSGWNGMDGAKGSLSYIADWANSGDQLVLGVPIIPKSLGAAVGSLQAGAQGTYDPYFTQLAKTLINEHLGNAWLRLGWEFDNSAYPWQAKTPAAEAYYAAYFQHIVTAMRAVSGANFKYVWNPDAYAFAGAADPVVPGYNVSDAWPGSAYVDSIGLDTYDLGPTPAYNPTTTWAWIAPQLAAAATFASSYAKPLAFPEWGVAVREVGMYGNGDDPGYITNMSAFMANRDNNVAWESYFNISELGWNSQITGAAFPKSLAAFQKDFGNG